jgi:hypothetical protein
MDDFNKMMSAILAGGATLNGWFLSPMATPSDLPAELDDPVAKPAINPLLNVPSASVPNRLLPPGMPSLNGTPGYAGASPSSRDSRRCPGTGRGLPGIATAEILTAPLEEFFRVARSRQTLSPSIRANSATRAFASIV